MGCVSETVLTDTVAAVDLGASSGRSWSAASGHTPWSCREAHRFANDPVALPDGLHWDVLRLYHDIVEGLRRAGRDRARTVERRRRTAGAWTTAFWMRPGGYSAILTTIVTAEPLPEWNESWRRCRANASTG